MNTSRTGCKEEIGYLYDVQKQVHIFSFLKYEYASNNI